MPRCLTIEEVARDWLACCDDVVRDRIKDGSLEAFNIGSQRRPTWRITEEALHRFVESRRAEAPTPVERNTRRKKLPPNIRKFV